MRKKLKLALILILAFTINTTNIKAVTIDQNETKLYFKDFGITGDKDTRFTRIKRINDNLAYCIQSKRDAGKKYQKNPLSDEKAKVAGKIIELINQDYKDGYFDKVTDFTNKKFGDNGKNTAAYIKYMYTDAALNTYFADKGYKTSVKYKDNQGYISKKIKAATTAVNAEKTTLSTPKLTQTISYSSLNTGGVISTQITLSNLVKDFNGSIPKYKITASSTNGGTAVICKNSNGSNCESSVTVTNDADNKYDFYIKVTGYTQTNNTDVSIKVVTDTVTYTYPVAVRYIEESDKDAYGEYQILVVPDTESKTAKASQSANFKISATPEPGKASHEINLYKLNEDGERLSGAKFTLSGTRFGNDVVGKETSTGLFEWSTSYTLGASETDNFYGQKYTIKETQAPEGYVKIGEYVFEATSSGKACYDETGKAVEEKYCDNSKYTDTCASGYTYIEKEKKCEKQSTEYVEKIGETTKDFTATGYVGVKYDFDKKNGTFKLENPEAIETIIGEDNTLTPDEINTLKTKYICDSIDAQNNNVCNNLYKIDNITYNENDNNYIISAYPYTSELPASEKVTPICNFNGTTVDKTCDELISNYTSVSSSGGNISINMYNARNSVKISKQRILGEESVEVSGAELKICTKEAYEKNKTTCEAATTIDNIKMEWISNSTPMEFRGLAKGEYYIIETTPPTGFVITDTVTPFSIDETGTVKSGNTEVKDNLIVINNETNTLSISKKDITTSKELPGAELKLCIALKNEKDEYYMPKAIDGDCLVTNLYDGSDASWISTDEEKIIVGLPTGTYYLVEKAAPNGYSTAESILFTMNNDGTITDKDGTPIENNKIIMQDEPIKEVKTGDLPILIIVLIAVLSISAGSYYYITANATTATNEINNNKETQDKIRKRKIRNNKKS